MYDVRCTEYTVNLAERDVHSREQSGVEMVEILNLCTQLILNLYKAHITVPTSQDAETPS
jgi:hypothetical protein